MRKLEQTGFALDLTQVRHTDCVMASVALRTTTNRYVVIPSPGRRVCVCAAQPHCRLQRQDNSIRISRTCAIPIFVAWRPIASTHRSSAFPAGADYQIDILRGCSTLNCRSPLPGQTASPPPRRMTSMSCALLKMNWNWN